MSFHYVLGLHFTHIMLFLIFICLLHTKGVSPTNGQLYRTILGTNSRILLTPDRMETVPSLSACALRCSFDMQCEGFNVNKIGISLSCELFYQKEIDIVGSSIEEAGSTYYEKVNVHLACIMNNYELQNKGRTYSYVTSSNCD